MILSDGASRSLPQPPFRAGPVYGKSIRMDRLPTPVEARFRETFGTFLLPPAENSNMEWLRKEGFETEPPFNLRRFAGGRALPRARYYAVCDDQAGFSSQTLAMELLSYAAIDPNFELEVVDLSDPSRASLLQALDPVSTQLCVQWNKKVIVACQRYAGFYPEAEHDPSHPARRVRFLVVPFEIIEIKSDRVLDLREKGAMEWLLALLWEYFPGVIFVEE